MPNPPSMKISVAIAFPANYRHVAAFRFILNVRSINIPEIALDFNPLLGST
jgi:hypothetical protein